MNKLWSDFLGAHGARFDRDGIATFGDAQAELAAAQDSAIVCDLSALAVLRVEGADAEAFLQ
jgi:glycine cleavage system aminomethyltransferase T